MGDPIEGAASDGATGAFERQDWATAHEQFAQADRATPLGAVDLERWAVAAYLVGDGPAAVDAWTRAHRAYEDLGAARDAVRCAFWLAFGLFNKGESARGGGWFDRARRLLDEGEECVEQGYLRYLAGLRLVFSGDAVAGRTVFGEAAKIGDRFASRELCALARVGEGRCLVYLGEHAAGVALLDEAMVAVTAGDVSPIAAGDIYCTVIQGCWELFDVRRAQEWTAALSHWCDAHPDLVLYRGECLLHRAEIMLLRGDWDGAAREVERACARLAHPPDQPAIGAATYTKAEVHRLRAEVSRAEDTYRRASELGRDPQPGLALLRLAEEKPAAAEASIRRSLDEAEDPVARSPLLAPYVEIMLATGQIDAARVAAEELTQTAEYLDSSFLRALALHATGAALLAGGDHHEAAVALRRAASDWRDLDAPYHLARARVLLGIVCRALADDDGADMELGAARRAFEQLAAAADLRALDRLEGSGTVVAVGGLTARELEVLALVATGRTNRAIANELVLSEKTVASHLSHIFTKLGVESRAAATAFAYEHGIV